MAMGRRGWVFMLVGAVALSCSGCGDVFRASGPSSAGGSGGTGASVSSSGGGGTSTGKTTSSSSSSSSTSSTTPKSCGDGVVQHAVEQCDDGNKVDGDACRNSCRLARCGDGIMWLESGVAFEQCDDGNDADGDGCSSSCALEGCASGPCPPAWPGGECAKGCDPSLCEGNSLCSTAGIECDGKQASECAGRCMLYAADCAAIKGWPDDPKSWELRSCLAACAGL